MKLAELGFLGMMVSPEYGGAGMDTVSYYYTWPVFFHYQRGG